MTEEEATAKRCCGPAGAGAYQVPPLHSVDIDSTGGILGHSLVPDQARVCIGSACMAFRWSEPVRMETVLLHREDLRPPGDGWVSGGEVEWTPKTKEDPLGQRTTPLPRWSWERPYPRAGYCGLAGKP